MRMKLQINEDVLSDTTRCKKQFACLSGNGQCLCKPDFCFNGRSCFIRPDSGLWCNYKVSFAGSYLCGCPTRKEIYKVYKI